MLLFFYFSYPNDKILVNMVKPAGNMLTMLIFYVQTKLKHMRMKTECCRIEKTIPNGGVFID